MVVLVCCYLYAAAIGLLKMPRSRHRVRSVQVMGYDGLELLTPPIAISAGPPRVFIFRSAAEMTLRMKILLSVLMASDSVPKMKAIAVVLPVADLLLLLLDPWAATFAKNAVLLISMLVKMVFPSCCVLLFGLVFQLQ